MDKINYQEIIGRHHGPGMIARKIPGCKFNDKSCDLGLQNVEIIGDDYK
jgi:hypothetical protein